MVRTCLGEFEFDAVLEREPVLGPSLLVLYCFIAGVTLLNLLIAVISRAWEDEVPHAVQHWSLVKTREVYRLKWDANDLARAADAQPLTIGVQFSGRFSSRARGSTLRTSLGIFGPSRRSSAVSGFSVRFDAKEKTRDVAPVGGAGTLTLPPPLNVLQAASCPLKAVLALLGVQVPAWVDLVWYILLYGIVCTAVFWVAYSCVAIHTMLTSLLPAALSHSVKIARRRFDARRLQSCCATNADAAQPPPKTDGSAPTPSPAAAAPPPPAPPPAAAAPPPPPPVPSLRPTARPSHLPKVPVDAGDSSTSGSDKSDAAASATVPTSSSADSAGAGALSSGACASIKRGAHASACAVEAALVGILTAAAAMVTICTATVVFVGLILPFVLLKGIATSLRQLPQLFAADRDAAAAALRRARRARALFLWDRAMIRSAIDGVGTDVDSPKAVRDLTEEDAPEKLTMAKLSQELGELAAAHRQLLAVATARASQQKTGASPQKPLLLAAAPTKLLPAASSGNKAGASGDAVEHWRECLAKFAGSEAASREALRNELRAFARQLNEPPPDELGPSAGADVQVAVPLGNNDAAAAAGAQRRRASRAGRRRSSFLPGKATSLQGEGNAALRARKARLEALRTSFEDLVVFSRNPIRWALLLQQEIVRFSRDHGLCQTSELRRYLRVLGAHFGSVAVRLLDYCPADEAIVGLVLEAGSPSNLELALSKNDFRLRNGALPAHPKAMQHVAAAWQGPTPVELPSLPSLAGGVSTLCAQAAATRKSLEKSLQPQHFVRAPRVRFFLQAILEGVELLFLHFSLRDASRNFVEETPSAQWLVPESCLLLFAVGTISFEVIEFSNASRSGAGAAAYFADPYNFLDTFACAGYMSYFSCRLATSTCLRFGEADGVVPEALWYQAFGLRSLALTAIVLWMRLTHLSSASEQLGPVVSAMWRVGYAVATFGLLLLCVTMGFVSLLVAWFGSTDYHAHYDDQGGIFEYRSLYYGLLTLCRALFGDFSFDFSGVGDPYWRALAETLMVLYMLMGAIAMLNILIAIVCSVFARVVETSEQESAALKTAQVIRWRWVPTAYWRVTDDATSDSPSKGSLTLAPVGDTAKVPPEFELPVPLNLLPLIIGFVERAISHARAKTAPQTTPAPIARHVAQHMLAMFASFVAVIMLFSSAVLIEVFGVFSLCVSLPFVALHRALETHEAIILHGSTLCLRDDGQKPDDNGITPRTVAHPFFSSPPAPPEKPEPPSVLPPPPAPPPAARRGSRVSKPNQGEAYSAMAPAQVRSVAVTPDARTDDGAAFNPMSTPTGDEKFSDSGSDDDDEHEQKTAPKSKDRKLRFSVKEQLDRQEAESNRRFKLRTAAPQRPAMCSLPQPDPWPLLALIGATVQVVAVLASGSVLLAGHLLSALVSAPVLTMALGSSLLSASCHVHERLREAAHDIMLARLRGSSANAPGFARSRSASMDGASSRTSPAASPLWEPAEGHETKFCWDPRVVRHCVDEGGFRESGAKEDDAAQASADALAEMKRVRAELEEALRA